MVPFCIQLYTVKFCNIKQLKMSIRRYLQTFTPTGLSSFSWLCTPQFSSLATCMATTEGGPVQKT